MTENHNSYIGKRDGIVYLVGAGPGDPGLITVKGMDIIRSADVIVYDYLAGRELLEEARLDAELIYVGKKGRHHTLEQQQINELIATKAREGKRVARLKGGDPYVFGRGGEEAEELVKLGIPFEVVPGVTSAVAAPAYAGIPVTHRDHASTVTFVTGHEDPGKTEPTTDWAVLAANPGTLVFLMGVQNLGSISESLIKHGKAPSTPAALVQWGTTPAQVSLVSTLEAIAQDARRRSIKPPAVVVVGSVVSLANRLAWFEKKPLFGKSVLITRSRRQSKRMADRIIANGGRPLLFPTIEIRPPQDMGPLDHSIKRIGDFDWVIFTSVNGVEYFFRRFFQLREDIREMAGPKVAAIGPVTADSVRNFGIKVDLIAAEFKAEGVLAQLEPRDVRGRRFLIPRAEKAREILPEQIAQMGGDVAVVAVYRTVMPEDSDVEEIRDMLRQNSIDVVTFTSSSTVNHFAEMLGDSDVQELTQGAVLASIGPITSRTMHEHGLQPTLEARQYTVEGLINELMNYFKRAAPRAS